MPKRLTATEKWNDPWFCGLKPQDKLFWVYLCDNCNHAGIWQVNWPLVKFHLGDYQFEKDVFNGRIDFLDDETWFLRKFVFFQQKISSIEELNPANKCHLSIINILSSKGLTSPREAPIKGLRRGQGNSIGKGIGKDIITVFDFFCLQTKKSLKLTPERIAVIEKCLAKGRSVEDIKTAIDNFSKDDWPERQKHMDLVYAIGVIRNIDKFDSWFNYKPKSDKSTGWHEEGGKL